jgi:hypothetical protein
MTPRAGDAERARLVAVAEAALECAEAIARREMNRAHAGRPHDHVAGLRQVAYRSDTLGLSTLGDAARLMETVLIAPRSTEALRRQAVDVLTLAGRDARRDSRAVPANLGPVVDALRAHVRYTCEGA